MEPIELYRHIFGVEAPWHVTSVELRKNASEVVVTIVRTTKDAPVCPICGKPASGYDKRPRRWRHLDTCQFPTYVEADIPRVQCPEHGVRQVRVPWAEEGSGFTTLFESLVIDWLKCASTSEVARLMRLSWGTVDRIRQQAVARGLARRKATIIEHLSVDETSFEKRHEYVTVLSDQSTGAVVHVADDRTTESLLDYLQPLTDDQRSGIRTVSMDMWPAYINAVVAHVPDAEKKVCFDKFHIAQHLGRAVDQVRRTEHNALLKNSDERLKRTRYLWLSNPNTISEHRWEEFASLRSSTLKTARAWALKEEAMQVIQRYRSPSWAAKAWGWWFSWAMRSRLEPIKKAARMIKKHLWGILNAMKHGRTNALAESINSRIQRIKRQACGFRNRDRFRTAIYFHLGQLDLYPRPTEP